MRDAQRVFYVRLLVLVIALPGTVLPGAGLPQRMVDLSTLVELVIHHDPSLEALRGAIADADFKVAVSDRGRSPEIRAQFGETGSWSVPDPYTETSIETTMSSTAVDGTTTQTGEDSSQVTFRTITPERNGETIHETVTETVPAATSDQGGASTQRVVSESVERREYGRDVYGGSSSYSVQLRLFPRNPLLRKVTRSRQEMVRTHAERLLEAALARAALSVAREHREVQFMLAELKMMERRAALLRSDLADLTELKAARAINPADYHKRRTDALIHLSRMTELKRSIVDASVRLKNRAGLAEDSRIAFAGSLLPPRTDLGSLDRTRLLALAEPRSVALGSVRFAKSTVVSDLDADRAERIPWVSFVSLDYDIDDTVAGQTRDEWSVYAGVSLPVWAWMDGDSRRALKTRLSSVEQQELLTRRALELTVDALCRSLGSAQADWITFARTAREAKEGIERQMATIDGGDLMARRTRLALEDSLIDIDLQRLKLAHRLTNQLFDLCDAIGCDLDQVLSGGSDWQRAGEDRP